MTIRCERCKKPITGKDIRSLNYVTAFKFDHAKDVLESCLVEHYDCYKSCQEKDKKQCPPN